MSRPAETASDADITEPRLWRKNGWTARVIRNDEDEGWAVEMTRTGDPEPALVGPWVMGRDKKNPKPLGIGDFTTLVKAASEVLMRHEQAMAPRRLQFTGFDANGDRWRVETLDVHDEDDPHTRVTARDSKDELLHEKRVRLGTKLNAASAETFATTGELKAR